MDGPVRPLAGNRGLNDNGALKGARSSRRSASLTAEPVPRPAVAVSVGSERPPPVTAAPDVLRAGERGGCVRLRRPPRLPCVLPDELHGRRSESERWQAQVRQEPTEKDTSYC